MKKRLMMCLLLLCLLPLLFACDMGGGLGGNENGEEPGDEGNSYKTVKIAYYHPDETKTTWIDATFLNGELSHIWDLNADKITFKNPHLTFAGLFTEKEGGEMVVDAEGKRVPDSQMKADNKYYVQGKGEPITVRVTLGTGVTLSANLPKTVNYGEAFAEALPIPTLEGRRFRGWYETGEGFITGPDGVVYDQYRTLSSHHQINVQYEWLTDNIVSRRIDLTPYFFVEEENYYNVTFAFNDGTYRESVTKVVPGTAYESLTMPEGAGELREIVGWSLDPNSYVRPIGNVVENVTLYAVWKNYRYSCVVDGFGVERVEKVYEGESFSLGTPPQRAGYTFAGWYDNEAFIGSPVADTVTYGNARAYYYARWVED